MIAVALLLYTTLLLGLGLLAGRALRRSGAAPIAMLYRLTLAATLAGAALSPLLARALPHSWSVALPGMVPAPGVRAPGPAGTPSTSPPATSATGSAALVGSSRTRTPAPPPPRRSDRSPSWSTPPVSRPGDSVPLPHPPREPLPLWLSPYLGALWIAGVALLLLRLLLCRLRLARLLRDAEPIHEGPAPAMLALLCERMKLAAPRLLAHPRVRSPFLTGPRRPALLLPATVPG